MIWWTSVVISGIVIVLVAASRVYLGVHWFSDAVAGLLLGSFFLLGVEALLALRAPAPRLRTRHRAAATVTKVDASAPP